MLAIRFAISDASKMAQRSQLHPAHKEHIRSAPFQVLLSGPAFENGRNNPAAALLVANVDSLADLEAFNADDPFVVSGIYIQTWLLEWRSSLGSDLETVMAELAKTQ